VSNSVSTTCYCLCLDILLYSLFFCVACTLNLALLGSVGKNLAVNLWNVSSKHNRNPLTHLWTQAWWVIHGRRTPYVYRRKNGQKRDPVEGKAQKSPEVFLWGLWKGVLVTVISRGLWTARAPDLTPHDFHWLAHWRESLQNERKMVKENRRREDFEVPRNFFKRITGYVTCTASVSTCADSILSILRCRQADVIESDSSFLLRQSDNAWRWFMQFLPAVSEWRYVQHYPQSCCAILNFGVRRDARVTDILRCTYRKISPSFGSYTYGSHSRSPLFT
jgi:hypothetical protein